VVRTRVGYAGGTTDSPTYRAIGDHTEALQVDYDPAVISYQQLLDVFWSDHEPCRSSWSKQYKAILFYHDAAQRRVAEASRDRIAKERGEAVQTEVVAAGTFYRAEDYHQKYYLRSSSVGDSVRELFDSEQAFVDSTAVARLNGHFGGHVPVDRLVEPMRRAGLAFEGDRRVNRVWRSEEAVAK